jgi:hypothetical protein
MIFTLSPFSLSMPDISFSHYCMISRQSSFHISFAVIARIAASFCHEFRHFFSLIFLLIAASPISPPLSLYFLLSFHTPFLFAAFLHAIGFRYYELDAIFITAAASAAPCHTPGATPHFAMPPFR